MRGHARKKKTGQKVFEARCFKGVISEIWEWFTRVKNGRGEAGGCKEQGQAVIIGVDYTGPYVERAGFWYLSEERCSHEGSRRRWILAE